MDRDEALAIAFANLKGSRSKDLLATARALSYLKGLPQFGSNAKVGEAVGVSGEIVREFVGLLELPNTIQKLLASGHLKLEHGRRLRQLQITRPALVKETAQAMKGLTALDGRHLVEYIRRHPELPVSESRQKVLSSKGTTEREYHIVAIVAEPEYKNLSAEARKRRLSLDALVALIVRQWLESGPARE